MESKRRMCQSFCPYEGGVEVKESDIVRAIMRYLKTIPGCFAWKEHGGMYGVAGIPDIICCCNGRFIAFEVKTDKGKPTELQKATIRKIQAAGGIAIVVRSADEVKTVIEGKQKVYHEYRPGSINTADL